MNHQPGDKPFLKSVMLRRDWVESSEDRPYSIPAIKHVTYRDTTILHLTADRIICANYPNTEHYKVTRAFLTRTEIDA
jgi:predicted ATPase